MITVPSNTVTCTITPVEDGPPGAFIYSIGCAHIAPFSSHALAPGLALVNIGGVQSIGRLANFPDQSGWKPSQKELINFYMDRAALIGIDLEACECWRQWVMRRGLYQAEVCPVPEFSRQ